MIDCIRWFFAPLFAWWGFMAVVPHLVYLVLGTVVLCALGYLLLQFLRLFRK